MASEPGDDPTMAFVPTRTRISVERYHKMVETGVFTRSDRIELIDGEMLDMAPIGLEHVALSAHLTKLLVLALGDAAVVSPGGSVALGAYSESQPDLAVLMPRADFYRGKRPEAADTLLLIEISDSSLAFDRGIKRVLYARHAIPDYWVVDVAGCAIHVYREPSATGFEWSETVGVDGSVVPLAFPQLRIAVGELFPA